MRCARGGPSASAPAALGVGAVDAAIRHLALVVGGRPVLWDERITAGALALLGGGRQRAAKLAVGGGGISSHSGGRQGSRHGDAGLGHGRGHAPGVVAALRPPQEARPRGALLLSRPTSPTSRGVGGLVRWVARALTAAQRFPLAAGALGAASNHPRRQEASGASTAAVGSLCGLGRLRRGATLRRGVHRRPILMLLLAQRHHRRRRARSPLRAAGAGAAEELLLRLFPPE
mmetsp:Transcript_98906/g.284176  ORF Transcript_98906/g.284176 Transcript_98906/m.284176 type:complete len:231 (-) Transcript_98906:410-1102(-)